MNMSPTNYSAANYGGYCPERPRFALVILFLLVLPLLAISGCTVVTKSTVIAPQIQDLFDGKYQVYPAMAKARPVSVAILPFVDVSKSQAGAQAVRRGFYNHFSSLPFRDMELWQVDDRLKKAGLTDPTVINQTDAKDLGKILGTDAIVYGEISNFDKLFAVLYSQVSVGRSSACTTDGRGNSSGRGNTSPGSMKGGFPPIPSAWSPRSSRRP